MANQLLEPVEGVTLDQYGHGCAWLTRGATKDDVIKALGIDMPKWDRIETEWKARMAADKSFSVTMAFSNAYTAAPPIPTGSATVEKSDIDPSKFPFDKYIEAMVAQDVLGKQGRDAQDVLKDFGLSVADYSNVSAFYSQKMMTDFSLAMQMQNLMNQYKAKYESMKSDSHSDLEF
jgi:hypothetical protein